MRQFFNLSERCVAIACEQPTHASTGAELARAIAPIPVGDGCTRTAPDIRLSRRTDQLAEADPIARDALSAGTRSGLL